MPVIDDLQMYFGDDLIINEKLRIRQPTMRDVIEMGEEQYYSIVFALTAISSDMKSILWDSGVDWTEVSDIEMFSLMTSRLAPDSTHIFFGGLDLTQFKLWRREDGDLFMSNGDIVIDLYIHKQISDFLCKVHCITKKPEFAGNEHTKLVMIEDDRIRAKKQKGKKYESQLAPLISSMVNSEGFKYNIEQVRDMRLYAFMDSVRRISTIRMTGSLTSAYYSGNIDTEKFDTKKLDWLRDFSDKK